MAMTYTRQPAGKFKKKKNNNKNKQTNKQTNKFPTLSFMMSRTFRLARRTAAFGWITTMLYKLLLDNESPIIGNPAITWKKYSTSSFRKSTTCKLIYNFSHHESVRGTSAVKIIGVHRRTLTISSITSIW